MKRIKSILQRKKEKAQNIFNTWVRMRDSIETDGTPFAAICCTCGKWTQNNGDLQASHFILDSKNGNSTSFDPVNVNSSCKKCNRFLHGNLGNYALFIINKYGKDELDRLQRLKLINKKWTIDELDEIYKTYKYKIDHFYDDN